MKLGLVTVLYKSDDVLPDFFKSIFLQEYKNYKLYLVDNSPSAETRELITYLNQKYTLSEIEHIENKTNIGVAAANNVGIKKSILDGCEDLIILNNDIFFSDTKLFEKLILLAKQNHYAVIAPKIFFYNSNKLWYAGSTFIKWCVNVKHRGEFIEDYNQFKSGKTQYAPTCFVYVKKEVFEKVGLMDERYFVYVDDVDFMYRVVNFGYNIWYENELSIEHKISQSTGGKFSDFSLFYTIRNRVFFARKFYTPLQTIVVALYTWLSLSYHIIFTAKKPTALLNVVKAIRAGYNMPC